MSVSNGIICGPRMTHTKVDEPAVCITAGLNIDAHVMVMPTKKALDIWNFFGRGGCSFDQQPINSSHTTRDDTMGRDLFEICSSLFKFLWGGWKMVRKMITVVDCIDDTMTAAMKSCL